MILKLTGTGYISDILSLTKKPSLMWDLEVDIFNILLGKTFNTTDLLN